MTTTAPEFDYLRELVLDRCAVVIPPDKQYLIQSRLHPIARELGIGAVEELIAHARRTSDRRLQERIVNAMTTNETLWMRDVHPFNALRRVIIPDLVEQNRATRRLSIWSAACSTGQEIYSIAMMLEDDFPNLNGWSVDLRATDVNSEVVEKAKSGTYSKLEVNRGLPAAMLVRHFAQEGNGYRLNQHVRDRVRFTTMNLAGPWPVGLRVDILLLRNVLIYFDAATRERILRAAARCLTPGGYLLLGSNELMTGLRDVYVAEQAERATYFRLKGGR